ncbi:MAG: hypothetical protein ACYTXY_53270, partial [Nostoc sp.]
MRDAQEVDRCSDVYDGLRLRITGIVHKKYTVGAMSTTGFAYASQVLCIRSRLLVRSPSLDNKLGDRIKPSNPQLTIRVLCP